MSLTSSPFLPSIIRQLADREPFGTSTAYIADSCESKRKDLQLQHMICLHIHAFSSRLVEVELPGPGCTALCLKLLGLKLDMRVAAIALIFKAIDKISGSVSKLLKP